jgi:hypothetical protein
MSVSRLNKSDRIRSGQLWAVVVVVAAEADEQARERIGTTRMSTEEYKKSACENSTCDLKILCML